MTGWTAVVVGLGLLAATFGMLAFHSRERR